MKHRNPVHAFLKSVRAYKKQALVFGIGAIALLAIAVLPLASKGFVSTEVRFADLSHKGLSIVPASCPSSPHFVGDCTQGSCPPGTVFDYSTGTCVSSCTTPVCPGGGGECPLGYVYTPYGCVYSGCPSGYVLFGLTCVVSSCPLGYTFQGGSCVFTGCPANYVLQSGTCVYVAPPVCTAAYSCVGSNLYFTDASCNSSLVQSCSYGCTSGQCNPTPSPTIVTWKVHPTLVRKNDTVLVTWEVQNVTSCTVTGDNGDSWSGTSGSQTSSPITSQTKYTLSCVAYPGAPIPWVDQRTTVSVIPGFIEQ